MRRSLKKSRMNKTEKELGETTLKINEFLKEQLSIFPSTNNLSNPKYIFSREPFAYVEETTSPFMEYKEEFDKKLKAFLPDEKSFLKYVVNCKISEIAKRQDRMNIVGNFLVIVYVMLSLIGFQVFANFKICYLLVSILVFVAIILNIFSFYLSSSLEHKFQIIQIFLED